MGVDAPVETLSLTSATEPKPDQNRGVKTVDFFVDTS